jgi:hypothetical protein
MNDINIFEYAAKNKLRFPYKGSIATEDLYDLSLNELDEIYKKLNKKLKASQEDSLLEKKSEKDTALEVLIEIVKYIVKSKQDEIDDATKALARNQKKQKILALIEEKDNEDLRNKSKEELLKMVEEM